MKISAGNAADTGADYWAFGALLHLIIALFFTLLYIYAREGRRFLLAEGLLPEVLSNFSSIGIDVYDERFARGAVIGRNADIYICGEKFWHYGLVVYESHVPRALPLLIHYDGIERHIDGLTRTWVVCLTSLYAQ